MDRIRIFNVEYHHETLPNGDELYYTKFGLPYREQLAPGNFWTDRKWFKKHATGLFGYHSRYGGTGTVYKVQTKPASGKSIDIVLKWNRMGQDIPGAHESEELREAEFNSPFEEFNLVMELRDTENPMMGRIRTKRPMAIYVPAARMEPWQSARKDHKMRKLQRRHRNVEIDVLRNYAVIYEWLKGVDAVEAVHRGLLTEEEMEELVLRSRRSMEAKGFLVRDHKPQHVIVRPVEEEQELLRDREGDFAYGLIDFELLEHTPERRQQLRLAKRKEYLRRQAHRFNVEDEQELPAHLSRVRIMGIDYIYGVTPSTNGELWVVGNDPSLFEYFLPERWERADRTRLSTYDEVYHTYTRDNVQLVWKQSRVGQTPNVDPYRPDERRIMQHGFNSPFEEVALSVELESKGIPSTYARAIYMVGHSTFLSEHLSDQRRYESHRHLRTPDGKPILRKENDYINIWGYWNKPDEMLAEEDSNYYEAVDALQALRHEMIEEEEYLALVQRMNKRLRLVGIEDLNLRGTHILLSLDSDGRFVRDVELNLELRLCSYELLKKLD